MNLVEPFVARARSDPDKEAAVFGPGRRLSYRELLHQVHSLAAALLEAGVVRGDVVATLVGEPLPEVATLLALAWIGAISMPIGTAAGSDDELLERAGAKIFLHNVSDADALVPRIERRIALGSVQPTRGVQAPIAQVAPDDLWRIGLSSGTTGTPKAIRFTVGAHMEKARRAAAGFAIGRDDRVAFAIGAALPVATAFWTAALYEGATLLLPPQDGGETCRILHEESATLAFASAGSAVAMLEAARAPGSPHSLPGASLRLLAIPGSFVAPALRSQLRDHIAPALCTIYGTSESGPIAITTAELENAYPDCAGRVVPGVEVEAVDEEGALLQRGQPGRLRVRTPTMAAGYIGQARQDSVEGFRDGWFYTSDRGHVTANGLVYLEGRMGDVLNMYGNKISAAKLEGAIAEDPAVSECAVIQLHDSQGRPVLIAVVVASEGFDAEATAQRCEDRFSRLLAPRNFVRVPRLPRNAAGKVMRDEVAAGCEFPEAQAPR